MIIEQELRIEIDRLNIRLLQLNDEIESYCEIKNDLQQRIDKSIKIIESYNLGKYDYSVPLLGIIELLEILKGSVNNEIN